MLRNMGNDVGIHRTNAVEGGMMLEYSEGMLRKMGNDVGTYRRNAEEGEE